MKKLAIKILRKLNYELVRLHGATKASIPADFEALHLEIYKKVCNNTMTSPERIYSLIEAVKYIERNNIDGAVVECGVWKGGSMMAVAETLLHLNNTARDLYLYDTYEGMSAPTEDDKTFSGESAEHLLNQDDNKEKNLVWAFSALETVKAGMQSTGYPDGKINYIKGKVEDTIPANIPGKIALLRLDTDWYESTKHELVHLFPLLAKNGVLILDDYGHWAGAKKAVDEYIAEKQISILLNRIDSTGRVAIKQS